MSRKQNNNINGFNRFQPKDKNIATILQKLEDKDTQQTTLQTLVEDAMNGRDYRKEIYLHVLEQYISTKKAALFVLEDPELPFETRLKNSLGITIDDFISYERDVHFIKKHTNIQHTKLMNEINLIREQTTDPQQKLKAEESIKKILDTQEAPDAAFPVEQWNKFMEYMIKKNKMHAKALMHFLQDKFIPTIKEKLDNTMYSDDGSELLINKDYDRSPYIIITHNGVDITNEVNIEIKDELFNHNQRSNIMEYYNHEIMTNTEALDQFILNEIH